jgi:NADH-quinone oxidoreductase subunit E
MLRGSDELIEGMCEHLGVEHSHGAVTTPDGEITIQEAQCLGACDKAPCIQVDAENTIGPLGQAEANALLDELRVADRPRELWR